MIALQSAMIVIVVQSSDTIPSAYTLQIASIDLVMKLMHWYNGMLESCVEPTSLISILCDLTERPGITIPVSNSYCDTRDWL